ncbi:unnamed protein product [Periconia digitata]|uniref:Uncharacterized protein n=1 Tax=Periconia digitata TaxID=1303443 RepID=A0A9W4U8S3_9PLEO|nr:unnamed protein product [Periconia digitata]
MQEQNLPKNPAEADEEEEMLKAQCHCGGVSFSILRPLPPSSSPSSPTRTRGENEPKSDILPPSLTPQNPSKWFALLDVCNTCRLTSGCAVAAWCFPLASPLHNPLRHPETILFYPWSTAYFLREMRRDGVV